MTQEDKDKIIDCVRISIYKELMKKEEYVEIFMKYWRKKHKED